MRYWNDDCVTRIASFYYEKMSVLNMQDFYFWTSWISYWGVDSDSETSCSGKGCLIAFGHRGWVISRCKSRSFHSWRTVSGYRDSQTSVVGCKDWVTECWTGKQKALCKVG